jgi:hypothetical protein
MTCDFDEARTADALYRVGRAPNPWTWPDWEYANPDGTFGSRWDDPHGNYRVLYACGVRLGAFAEKLANFRPDQDVVDELDEIAGDDADVESVPAGSVQVEWIEKTLMVGTATTFGVFAQVGTSRSLAYLRKELIHRALHHGLHDIDGDVIRRKAPRRFTQEISQLIYACTGEYGEPAFSGVSYLSRLGDDFPNWAIFEPSGGAPVPLEPDDGKRIERDDDDLLAAVELLELTLVPPA